MVGVIDGLGHGEPAQVAALAAQSYVQSHYDSALDQTFLRSQPRCRGTRGVVMDLVRFESSNRNDVRPISATSRYAPWTGAQRLADRDSARVPGCAEDHVRVQQHRWDPQLDARPSQRWSARAMAVELTFLGWNARLRKLLRTKLLQQYWRRRTMTPQFLRSKAGALNHDRPAVPPSPGRPPRAIRRP